MVLVDTCGWIEWLIDGDLANDFEAALLDTDRLLVPTSVQFELYKGAQLLTCDDHFDGLAGVTYLPKP